jgi:hypothetical protein
MAAVTAGLALAVLDLARGQQIHQNRFEGRDPAWLKGAADAAFHETAHGVTDQTAHTGDHSEYIELTAEQGSYIYYVYPVGRAPISDELSARLWLKANRPGVQLMARVVLPRERDPNNLDGRLTTLIRGDAYQYVGRWEPLELRRPVKLAAQQQQLMRLELKRDVNFTDAYIDQIALNVYGGPGETKVWIDDLEIGPVTEAAPFQTTGRAAAAGQPRLPLAQPRIPTRPAVVEFRDDTLLVNQQRFFFRGIRHSDTPLKALRDAGFNTVWFDYTTPPGRLEEAIDLGFWVVPSLPVTSNDPRLGTAEGISQEVTRWSAGDAVLFWDLGGGLASEEAPLVERARQVLRAADPQRPVGVDVWDGFRPYSMDVDLVGAHRWPLMTGLELMQYHDWLSQRLFLARPGACLWTWVQTHLPDWYTTLIYNRPGSAGFDEPIGPQPEQIRLLTYTALAAGCHGLGFWSDRFLADSHQGRDRLLALAMLNQEIQMLEPLLVTAETPRWIDTSIPEVKAAVLRTQRGLLVLPIWLGKGAQFCPGQSATAKLTMDVPAVPAGTQAWEVSPAEVRSLQTERVVGGVRVTVPQFGLTAAIVFTADSGGLLVRFQEQSRRMSKTAAQWAYQLAEVELAKVARVEGQLEQAGRAPKDAQRLLQNAQLRIRKCVECYNAGGFSQAYTEAEAVLRPLRILMRDQWEQATRGLDSPVASPYAVSFFSLPRHWQFIEELRHATAGSNVLPDGDFELGPEQSSQPWVPQQTTLDDVVMEARRVADQPRSGRQCLMLQIKPKDAETQARAALERTFLAINSPTVRLQPGTPVRISGWVRIPKAITASADGALLFDSAGGEPLAVRLTEATSWKRFTLYRWVPPSGTVNVTLALTGLGTVYFDDVRIEPLLTNTTVLRPAGAELPAR